MRKKHCKIRGCKRPYYAKGYCQLDYLAQRRRSKTQRKEAVKEGRAARSLRNYVMISACCKRTVSEGAVHEYGKQYCDKCKEACLWSYELRV